MPTKKPGRKRKGFSLVEVLVTLVVLSMVLVIVFGMTGQIAMVWKRSSQKMEEFQGARLALDAITRTVGNATLNVYYDYYNAARQRRTSANASTFIPQVYGRYSELEFVCGKSLVSLPRPQISQAIFFQAPLGYTQQTGTYSQLNSTLNTVGFYLEFNNDAADRPGFFASMLHRSPPRWRYRLMQFMQPTENFSVYDAQDHSWFTAPLNGASPPVRLLAENIVACVFCPLSPLDTKGSSLAPNFEYDSRMTWTTGAQPDPMNQLPPIVRVVLIAVDEASMARVQGQSASLPSLGFDPSNVFVSSAQLDGDIETVKAALAARHLNFTVFSVDVAVRGARWNK
ncbi:Verru_Chthon cassette protein C [Verrucomicrobium sp. GAS474]|uniref:Verru_Chthon cassette protein C n=1 Tax=Verrucomicrobium sp. GAS474 TaxID=1882831 RepID=UPI000879D1F5|nr:Verru_Chthon cassette protein C [Verrucomicrobium sp. GAS474]SDT89115.1 Verru_Chthon cassette protein C [Verrucomicrobium sp. GAS474]